MKKLLTVLLVVGLVGSSRAQTPVPPKATADDVVAGTDDYKYITAKSAADAGLGAGGGISWTISSNVAYSVSATQHVSLATNFLHASYVTPMQFGAAGDGNGYGLGTDDTDEWNAAIAGKTNETWIIDGANRTYKIDAAGGIISWTNNLVIRNATFVRTNVAGPVMTLGGHRVRLENCRFIGPGTNTVNGAEPSTTSIGLLTTNRPWQANFYNSMVEVDNCRFESFYYGIYASMLERPRIMHNQCVGNKGYGIYVTKVDTGKFEQNYTGIVWRADVESFWDTFFPSNTVMAWGSNSIGIHVQGPVHQTTFDGNSGGQARMAFRAIAPNGTDENITGLMVVNPQIEDILNYDALRMCMYFSNVAGVKIINGQFLRITGSLPEAFNVVLANCYNTGSEIDVGAAYSSGGSTPAVAFYDAGVVGGQDSLTPFVKRATTVRQLSSLAAMTGTDVVWTMGTVPNMAMAGQWRQNQLYYAENTTYDKWNFQSGRSTSDDVVVGASFGGTTIPSAGSGQTVFVMAGIGPGSVLTPLIGWQDAADNTANMYIGGDYGSGRPAPSRISISTSSSYHSGATERWRFTGGAGGDFASQSTANNITGVGRVTATNLVLSADFTPANASASGTAGTVVFDDNYIYICTGPNTWKRAAIATW